MTMLATEVVFHITPTFELFKLIEVVNEKLYKMVHKLSGEVAQVGLSYTTQKFDTITNFIMACFL